MSRRNYLTRYTEAVHRANIDEAFRNQMTLSGVKAYPSGICGMLVSGEFTRSGVVYGLRTGDGRPPAEVAIPKKPTPEIVQLITRSREIHFNTLDVLRLAYEHQVVLQLIDSRRNWLDIEIRIHVPKTWLKKVLRLLSPLVEVTLQPLQEYQSTRLLASRIAL